MLPLEHLLKKLEIYTFHELIQIVHIQRVIVTYIPIMSIIEAHFLIDIPIKTSCNDKKYSKNNLN